MERLRRTLTGVSLALLLATGSVNAGEKPKGEVSVRAQTQEGDTTLRLRLIGALNNTNFSLGGLYDCDPQHPTKGYGLFNARGKTPLQGVEIGIADSVDHGEHTPGIAIAYTVNGKRMSGFIQAVQPFDGSGAIYFGAGTANLDEIIREGMGKITVFVKANQGEIQADELVYVNGHLYMTARNLITGGPNQYGAGVRINF